MGSYINIGLICDKRDFREKVVSLVHSIKGFSCKKIEYPTDEKYSGWIENSLEQIGIDTAIDYCLKYNMAKIIGNFMLGDYDIKDVIFQVESYMDHANCFLIEMPEQQNHIFEDIDKAEKIIISFLKEISGFSKGFCDSEARAEDKNGYAISVDYTPSANIILQSWKIDGLTCRE